MGLKEFYGEGIQDDREDSLERAKQRNIVFLGQSFRTESEMINQFGG